MHSFIPRFLGAFKNVFKLLCTSSLSSKQCGFSLLEMLLVLGVVGILAKMAVPYYQAVMIQREINAIAYELAQSIELARTNAQSYGREVNVCPVAVQQLHNPTPSCDTGLARSSPWLAWVVKVQATNEVLLRSRVVPANILVLSNVSKGQGFDLMGHSVFSGSTIIVEPRNLMADVSTMKITLAPTGRVRVNVCRRVKNECV